MSFTTFLLRLVGRSPEQVKQQERFERNMKKLDASDEELDELLAEIRGVDQASQEKKGTLDSIRPFEGIQDVRIELTSETDFNPGSDL